MNLSISDRITRAKIQIQRSNPFFAYLSLYLAFEECKELPPWAGAGVDIKGNFFYKKEFVEGITDNELTGVIVHEILHLSLLHLTRRGSRDPDGFNIAADICVNQIIKDNGLSLPKGCLVSDYSNKIKLFGFEIIDCHKKTTEEIYEELRKLAQKKGKKKGKSKNGEEEDDSDDFGDGIKGRFDKHIEDAYGKELTPEQKRQLEKEWLGKVEEAYVSAKMRGQLPVGLERLIGKLHDSKVNWRALLQKYIIQQLPYNYTYSRPNKRSISAGIYMPDVVKDKIKVTVGLDLSGSIGNEELSEFISEVVGMARAYRERISFRLLTHDVDVQSDYLVENGNVAKIMKLQLKGGGGTSHKPIFEHIAKDKECKLAVFFTDGYSDINEIDMNKYRFNKLFLISKNGDGTNIKNARVIKIEEN